MKPLVINSLKIMAVVVGFATGVLFIVLALYCLFMFIAGIFCKRYAWYTDGVTEDAMDMIEMDTR